MDICDCRVDFATEKKGFGSGPSPILISKDQSCPEVPRSRGPKVQRSINKNKYKSKSLTLKKVLLVIIHE